MDSVTAATDAGPLTQENIGEIGLDELPQGSLTESEIGGWLYSIGSDILPASMSVTDIYGDVRNYRIEWTFLPQGTDGYALSNVSQEDLDQGIYTSIDLPGWYYVFIEDLQYHIVLRQCKLFPLLHLSMSF